MSRIADKAREVVEQAIEKAGRTPRCIYISRARKALYTAGFTTVNITNVSDTLRQLGFLVVGKIVYSQEA